MSAYSTYELGQPKSGHRFLESNLVNHGEVGHGRRKRWPWHNSAYADQNIWDPTQARRDIQENSKLPFSGNIFRIHSWWQLRKSSFPTKMKPGVDHPEDTRRRQISISMPNSLPQKGYDQVWFQYIEHVMIRTGRITAMPRSILCEFLSEILNRHLNRIAGMQTNGKPGHLFFRQVSVALVFCLIAASSIHLEQKEKEWFGLSICWLMWKPCKKFLSKYSRLSGA